MAISFIGSADNGSAANTDTTITLPGSMAVDDLIIVCYAIGDNDSVDQNVAMVTGGYTEVADLFANSAGTQDASLGVYYAYHNGTDTTAVCDALSAGTDAAVAGVLMVFRGVATVADGGPFDTAATTATGTGFNADPPSITPSTTGLWIVIAGGSGNGAHGTGLQANPYTNPANYTTNADGAGFGDTSDVSVAMGYRSSGAGSPEDPGVMTHSGVDSTTNYNWAAVTMALKEAPAVTDVQFGVHYADRSIYPGPTS